MPAILLKHSYDCCKHEYSTDLSHRVVVSMRLLDDRVLYVFWQIVLIKCYVLCLRYMDWYRET